MKSFKSAVQKACTLLKGKSPNPRGYFLVHNMLLEASLSGDSGLRNFFLYETLFVDTIGSETGL